MQRVLTAPMRAVARITLAIKFYTRLDYSWHLAWIKSAR